MSSTRKKEDSSLGAKMFQVIRSIDFTTVFVHLVLITAGAFIAIFLSNLQQERIEQKKEIIMLEQLEQSLTADLQNLEQFAEYHQAMAFETNNLRQRLVRQRPWNDSMSQLLYTISSTGVVYPHSGAFESLKSTGIDRIQNAEIRLRLFTVYEENFKSLNRQEDDYNKILSQMWLPFISDQIMIDSSPRMMHPVDLKSFSQNIRLLNFVTIFNIENNTLLYSIRQTIVEATLLQRQIQFELERIQRGDQYDATPKMVKMTLKGFSNASVVTVAGTFNNWQTDADTMKKGADNWCLEIPLKPNWYMYKFIVDGLWMEDPDNPEKIQTEYQTYNSILKVE